MDNNQRVENKVKDNSKRIFTVPNILSFSRILLIPVFFWLYLGLENYLLATIVILISGATDVIDGFIARKFNLITNVGKAIDPLADKLTQAAVLIALMFRFQYMFLVFAILALKEILMLIYGTILYKHTKELIGSNWHGKAAAGVVYLMLLTHLIWGIKATIPPVVSYVSTVLTIGAMATSFVLYSIEYFRLYKKHGII